MGARERGRERDRMNVHVHIHEYCPPSVPPSLFLYAYTKCSEDDES